MSRPHALAVSVVLALAAAAGVWAVTSTGAVRGEATKPELANDRAIARRSKQLGAWQASLERAARARPPALPAVPHYPRLPRVAAPTAAPLPAFVPPRTTAASRPVPAPRPRASKTGAAALVSARPAPAAPASPAAPTTPAASTSTPEQQCEALKQAAESQGEAARRAAEEQCRKLLGDGSEGSDG